MSQDYFNRFEGLARGIERFLIRAAVICFTLLVVGQFLLANQGTRFFLSAVDRLEGVQLFEVYSDALEYGPGQTGGAGTTPQDDEGPDGAGHRDGKSSWDSAGNVTIRLMNARWAFFAVVLVNGEAVASFRRREVTAAVRDGDLLEIDGATYRRDLVFEVMAASAKVVAPLAGTRLTTKKSIESFGRVRLGPSP